MKFNVSSDLLKKAVSHARSVVERSQTSKILGNVLIEADGGPVKMRATDLKIEFLARLESSVERSGATTVSSTILNDFTRRLPNGIAVGLDYDAASERLKIVAGSSEATLLTLPKEDFPAMSEEDYATTFLVPAAGMLRLFGKTRNALGDDGAREYLRGIYFHHDDSEEFPKLRCVSTDGFKLALAEMDAPDGSAEMAGVIIPEKAVLELLRFIEGPAGDIEVSVSPSKIRFAAANSSFSTRVIAAKFPNYRKLIPTSNDQILVVDANAFKQAMLRLSAIGQPNIVSVQLSLDHDYLLASANDPMFGLIKEEIPASFPHKKQDIKFNLGHMLGIAEQLSEGKVTVALQASAGATLITCDQDIGLKYVVMPLRG